VDGIDFFVLQFSDYFTHTIKEKYGYFKAIMHNAMVYLMLRTKTFELKKIEHLNKKNKCKREIKNVMARGDVKNVSRQ